MVQHEGFHQVLEARTALVLVLPAPPLVPTTFRAYNRRRKGLARPCAHGWRQSLPVHTTPQQCLLFQRHYPESLLFSQHRLPPQLITRDPTFSHPESGQHVVNQGSERTFVVLNDRKGQRELFHSSRLCTKGRDGRRDGRLPLSTPPHSIAQRYGSFVRMTPVSLWRQNFFPSACL